MKLSIHELFKKFEEQNDKESKKNILRQFDSITLRLVLFYNFNTNIKFYINKFPQKYRKPDDLPGIQYSNLESFFKRIYLFTIGDPTADKLSQEKREILFLQNIESLPYQEAKVIIDMMNHNLQVKGLTKNLVNDVFPGIVK